MPYHLDPSHIEVREFATIGDMLMADEEFTLEDISDEDFPEIDMEFDDVL